MYSRIAQRVECRGGIRGDGAGDGGNDAAPRAVRVARDQGVESILFGQRPAVSHERKLTETMRQSPPSRDRAASVITA